MQLDHSKFQTLIKRLYATVNELNSLTGGRHFTPDGHMVGSIGECLVADAYDLNLKSASNKGYDAETTMGRKVEIKATQGSRVAFRSLAEHYIVIKLFLDGTFEEVYNGPGTLVWQSFHEKKRPSNGQFQMSLTKLEKLNAIVSVDDKIQLKNNI